MIDLKAIRAVAESANKCGIGVNPATVIALLDGLEAAEKDAARYRWMRDQDGFTLDRLIDGCETPMHVDEAVDTAMKEQK